MKILHIVGARPNFMKAAPVIRAISGRNSTRQVLVHTGQHYDADMSDVFFKQLGLPEPDKDLGVGSGSHARQTAEVMVRLEEVLIEEKPDLVLVYGDVNSTMAGAVVCSKLRIPVGHVEAGLRSFDRTMPEEINRLISPLGYAEFLCLQAKALVVITDSGGVQEETTFLQVPCLTLRENTERPVTVDMGTNILVGRDMDRLKKEFENIISGHGKQGRIPDLWDGRASERIADIMMK